METFFTFLERRVDDCSSLLCVGLDPDTQDLKAQTPEAALEFCTGIIKQTARYAAAFKPNAAFFEALGPQGWEALRTVIGAVGQESQRLGSRIPVILDAKRGDIASTAGAYARSAFENLGVDAVTLSPYLGRDSIEPFLAYPERGVFLLCKTSNPGSTDLQDMPVSLEGGVSEPLYLHVARLAAGWNRRNNIGLVVGATFPAALRQVRERAPEMWFLAPGVGSQGGELETALTAGLRKDGKGLLVNVSRSLARAENPGRFAADMRDQFLEFGRSSSGS